MELVDPSTTKPSVVLIPNVGSDIGERAKAVALTLKPVVVNFQNDDEELVLQFGVNAHLPPEDPPQIVIQDNDNSTESNSPVLPKLVKTNTKKRRMSVLLPLPERKSRKSSAVPLDTTATASMDVMSELDVTNASVTGAEADDEEEENRQNSGNQDREKKVAKRRGFSNMEWAPFNSYADKAQFDQQVEQSMLRVLKSVPTAIGIKRIYYCKECTKEGGPLLMVQHKDSGTALDCFILGDNFHPHFMKEGINYDTLLKKAKTNAALNTSMLATLNSPRLNQSQNKSPASSRASTQSPPPARLKSSGGRPKRPTPKRKKLAKKPRKSRVFETDTEGEDKTDSENEVLQLSSADDSIVESPSSSSKSQDNDKSISLRRTATKPARKRIRLIEIEGDE